MAFLFLLLMQQTTKEQELIYSVSRRHTRLSLSLLYYDLLSAASLFC